MATYLWFVQLQNFNSRLGINYEWWLKLLHGTTESCINGTHSYMPERAALAGEVTGICDNFSDEHFVRYL